MASWIDRFFQMSPEERAMTVVEDESTFTAFVNEAALAQERYRRWCLARKADPPTRPADIKTVLAGDVVYLAGFGLRHASTPQAAEVLTGNDGVDGIYRPVWLRRPQTEPITPAPAPDAMPELRQGDEVWAHGRWLSVYQPFPESQSVECVEPIMLKHSVISAVKRNGVVIWTRPEDQ